MKVLVLNCGSSSVKFAVFDTKEQVQTASGQVENIGTNAGRLRGSAGSNTTELQLEKPTHLNALQAIVEFLQKKNALVGELDGVGHRVVHGGEKFTDSILISTEVLHAIRQCNSLAPLHNPANITGIEEAKKIFPDTPQVAVFDTAFHQSIPRHAYIYPIPWNLYREHGVRRYGFHGTSHRFVTSRAAEILGKNLEDTCLISAHLGNGCSATAVIGGKSMDTTMGMTPLEGLVMGTRSGDIDPGLPAFLANNLGWDVEKINQVLNKKSGLLGISGLSQDMRTLIEKADEGNERAALAIDVFCFRLAKQVAALAVSLPRVDALIFTGGIGEHSPVVRSKTLAHLKILGFTEDPTANENSGKSANGLITTRESVRALVIGTDEELLIAHDTEAVIRALYGSKEDESKPFWKKLGSVLGQIKNVFRKKAKGEK